MTFHSDNYDFFFIIYFSYYSDKKDLFLNEKFYDKKESFCYMVIGVKVSSSNLFTYNH